MWVSYTIYNICHIIDYLPLSYKTILKRSRLVTEGKMVKGSGVHQVYGAMYEPMVCG